MVGSWVLFVLVWMVVGVVVVVSAWVWMVGFEFWVFWCGSGWGRLLRLVGLSLDAGCG